MFGSLSFSSKFSTCGHGIEFSRLLRTCVLFDLQQASSFNYWLKHLQFLTSRHSHLSHFVVVVVIVSSCLGLCVDWALSPITSSTPIEWVHVWIGSCNLGRKYYICYLLGSCFISWLMLLDLGFCLSLSLFTAPWLGSCFLKIRWAVVMDYCISWADSL